jgi:hypothetical protein
MATFRDVAPNVKVHYYDNQAPAAGLEVYVNGHSEKFTLLPNDSKTIVNEGIKVVITLTRQAAQEAVVNVDVTEPQ